MKGKIPSSRVAVKKEYFKDGKTLAYTLTEVPDDGEKPRVENFMICFAGYQYLLDSDYAELDDQGLGLPDEVWKQSELQAKFDNEYRTKLTRALEEIGWGGSVDDFSLIAKNYAPLPLDNFIEPANADSFLV